MHPDLMQELISQRAGEARAAVHAARLARSARRLRRARRGQATLGQTRHAA